eukprot:4356243-Pyramimonas_sp.AAC.1
MPVVPEVKYAANGRDPPDDELSADGDDDAAQVAAVVPVIVSSTSTVRVPPSDRGEASAADTTATWFDRNSS